MRVRALRHTTWLCVGISATYRIQFSLALQACCYDFLNFCLKVTWMKLIVSSLLIAAVCACALVAQNSTSQSPDEIQIRQLERAWNQSEAKQEVKAVSDLVADSLVYVDYDGSIMNKAEYMKWVAAPQQKADHLYDEGLTVQVYGNAAVVNGIYRETGTNKGKAYVIRSRFTDTWIRRNNTWQCVASQSTLIPNK